MPAALLRATDKVAIIGVGTSRYARSRPGETFISLAIDACVEALRDAGLAPVDIDGLCGSHAPAAAVHVGLGIPHLTWWANPGTPFNIQLIETVNAVAAGACTTAIVYHSTWRLPNNSGSAARDPMRVRMLERGATPARPPIPALSPAVPGTMSGPVGYAAWAQRYFDVFGAGREDLARVAINSRSWAAENPNAVMREPLSLDDYLSARMVREPMCVYDMDVPIDGGDALVITTTERAADLVERPVIVHAATNGLGGSPNEDQCESFDHTGQQVVARTLRERSEVSLRDCDLVMAYDGFSILTLLWLESLGFCGRGEAPDFARQHWDARRDRLMIDGRVPVNTHGGSLSEGGTQGVGHVREAVHQLRGTAGPRQIANCRTAVLGLGAMLYNAGGAILRVE
jgi:acetyl-CoA acetyltransferase